MVVQCNAHFFTGVRQIQQLFVVVGTVEKDKIDDHQVVAGAVAHQHGTVAVQNLTAGSGNCGAVGQRIGQFDFILGHGRLQLVHTQGVQTKNQSDQRHKDTDTDTGTSFHQIPPAFRTALASR